MLITRPLRGVARGVLNVSPRRSLSATTSFAARPRPRPAPKKSGTLPSLQNGPVELQLPPVALLKSAKKSGVLDIEPDRALSILRDYAEISTQRLPGTWEKRFCAEENITPRTLILLALILTRCKEKPRQSLGITLLFSASAIGEPSATIFLIDSALKNKRLDSPLYTAPFAHLRTLAAPPHSNIEAMVLLGKIYKYQGDKGMALQLFRQAASIKTSSIQEGMDSQLPLPGEGVASALVHMGIILEDQGNKSDAKDAFRKAALEHDDPTGYYHLARMEEELSEIQRTCLLKSAASGNLNAAVSLGEMHQTRARFPNAFGSATKERQMAKEWHYLSALAGKTDSMLHLIIMFTQEDKMQSALKWIEMAESSPRESVAKAIKELREDLESGKLREDIKNGKYDRELKGNYFITKRDDDTHR